MTPTRDSDSQGGDSFEPTTEKIQVEPEKPSPPPDPPAPAAQAAPLPWWKEIVQPFVDLVHSPRALWGVNVGYFLEGTAYFGILGYLALYFSDIVFKGVDHADEWAHDMVMVLTSGITLAMLFLGGRADKWGVRKALIWSFMVLLVGRVVLSLPAVIGLEPAGLWSPMHLVSLAGIVIVVVGYGVYQPAAYAAVRQFTNPKTAGMGYAMLYALMNFGSWICTFGFLLRDKNFMGLGIQGTFWVYTGLTVVSLLATVLLLSRSTVTQAIAKAKAETAQMKADDAAGKPVVEKVAVPLAMRIPNHAWLILLALVAVSLWRIPAPVNYVVAGLFVAFPVVVALLPSSGRDPIVRWVARHPLADARFFFFIFALIPVQTLFTYNWLVLPQYISRAYTGWIGEYFEIASNANPLLIFILTPMIAALTTRAKVYNMMVIGTAVMAAPAFLLAFGPIPAALLAYIVLMTIGEAMWSPRFLQYAAEIAPEGRTGEYMGVAQFPWFLTKVVVPLLYSGWMMDRYCPAEGAKNTGFMWLVFGFIAIVTPLLLVAARGWLGKDFKTKSA
jgi:proton-dependent oligopeptide transporter, POT family